MKMRRMESLPTMSLIISFPITLNGVDDVMEHRLIIPQGPTNHLYTTLPRLQLPTLLSGLNLSGSTILYPPSVVSLLFYLIAPNLVNRYQMVHILFPVGRN